MKLLLFLFIASFSNYASSQTKYNVNWDPVKCEHGLKVDNESIELNKMPKEDVSINITKGASKFDSINYLGSDGNTYKVHKNKLGYIQNSESFSFELKAGGNKITLQNETNELAYPYNLFTIIDTYTCKLILGEAKQETTKDEPPSTNINLLKNISVAEPMNNLNSIISEKYNSRIVIDCSPENKSKVQRRVGKGEKIKKHLRYGDMVNIYLINFNHYLYALNLDSRQVDVSFDPKIVLDLGPIDTIRQVVDVSSTGPDKSVSKSAIEKLHEYAIAVDQLEEFIFSVENNQNPNSDTLEKNKNTILNNINNSNIGSGTDIDLLYESLDTSMKNKYKSIYDRAKKLQEKRGKIRLLTYTLKANIAPIRIKSYDKLVFDLTIKDNKSNIIIEKREYEYLICGGLQINQSLGVLGHSLFDEEYAFSPVPAKDTTFATLNGLNVKASIPGPNGNKVDSILSIQDVTNQKIIKASSPSRTALSASTLTHLYYRGGWYGLGPTIGIGVDFFPRVNNIRYMIGGSIMVMDGRFRISIDAGCAFGKISVLSPSQKEGDILGPAATLVPTNEKSKRTFFLGISWNIPLTQQEKQGLD